MSKLIKYFLLFVLGFTGLLHSHLAVAVDLRDTNSHQASLLTDVQIVENIKLVKGIPPKYGEPQTDPHAAAIIRLGKKAGPGLVGKILDDRESKYFYSFQYKIGDVAHTLLCEIYHQDPSLALIRRKPPLDSGHGYYFADYVALVETRKGREELRDAWKKVVEESNQK